MGPLTFATSKQGRSEKETDISSEAGMIHSWRNNYLTFVETLHCGNLPICTCSPVPRAGLWAPVLRGLALLGGRGGDVVQN